MPTQANGFVYLGTVGRFAAADMGTQFFTRIADVNTVAGMPITITWPGNVGGMLCLVWARNVANTSFTLKHGNGSFTSPVDSASFGNRFLFSMIFGNTLSKPVSNAVNLTGETPNVTVAEATRLQGNYNLVHHIAARTLVNGQTIPATTWSMDYGYQFGGYVVSLTLPIKAGALPIDTAAVGVQFGGPVTLATNAPSQPLHAASKGYVDSLVAGISPAADFYRHSQPLMSSLWTVVHNLGRHPSVSAEDAVGNVMHGGVEYVSDDTLTISFSNAITGFANCT
jgi:hypothetical protein